jgi:hypothetical protein
MNFLGAVARVRVAYIRWDGTQTVHRRKLFAYNMSTDRIVIIDRQDASATVRVLDFNPIRVRSPKAVSLRDRGIISVPIGAFALARSLVVAKAPYDSGPFHRGELASRRNRRGVGLPFIETMMAKGFSVLSF